MTVHQRNMHTYHLKRCDFFAVVDFWVQYINSDLDVSSDSEEDEFNACCATADNFSLRY